MPQTQTLNYRTTAHQPLILSNTINTTETTSHPLKPSTNRPPRPLRLHPKPHQPKQPDQRPEQLIYWANNPCSLNGNKIDELRARLTSTSSTQRPHIIFISETWFSETSDTTISGYRLYNRNRDRRGGGVAIYVQENLNCSITKIDQLNSNKIEQIWIKLKFQKESLLLGCIYRPHDLNDDILDDIINSVKTASDKLVSIGCSSLLIYGDFNFSNTT